MPNPLLEDWTRPLACRPSTRSRTMISARLSTPPWTRRGPRSRRIADNPEPPDFANTIEALERADATLGRVLGAFGALAGADSTPARQALQRDFAPKLSAYGSEITSNRALFDRIETLWQQRDALDLTDEQARVLMLTRRSFVRAARSSKGAAADRLTRDQEPLAVLGTQFAQNLLADEAGWQMRLAEADLDGLPEFVTSALRAAGEARGQRTGRW